MSNKTIEYEKLQALVDKIVNIISKFVAQVKEVFIKAWSSVKDILNKKISVRTKKYKKGKTTESELNEWMKKSIDKFDKYDEKDI